MISTQRKYEVHITADAVDTKWDDASRPLWFRVSYVVAVATVGGLLAYFGLLRPDQNGYSALWRLMHDHLFRVDAGFPFALVFLMWLFFAAMGVRSIFTSGQMLHCDRSELTISKIPWLNFKGEWQSRAFIPAEVSQLELAIWPTRSRETYDFVRFRADDETHKILEGITAPAGYRVLKGLKSLGFDAKDISDVRYLAKEAIRDQRAEL